MVVITMAQIEKEYAAALFALAAENGCERKFSESLAQVSEVFSENPEYAEFLSSPSVSGRERVNALEQAVGEFVLEYVLSFLSLLCERRRIGSFEGCRREYDRLLREAEKRSTAFVTSAAELTEAQKAELKKRLEKLSGHSVDMNFSVDTELIGGIVVKMDDKLFDGSLKKRLQEIKEAIDS